MQFLVDLISWFINGPIQNDAPKPVELKVISTNAVEEKKPAKPTPKNVVEEILDDGRPENFLQELKSIKPLTKQYDKDRRDLEQEVKRLATKKRSSL